MKIMIISDIHDNLVNLEKCLKWCAGNSIEKIICCGDVTNSETLKTLSDNFSGEIFLVQGNGEIYEDEEVAILKNYTYGGRTAIWEIDGQKVGVCHEPFLIKEVFAKGSPDIIFYGHTHKPWVETQNKIQIVNPGTLGGVFTAPTFAVWDTKSGKLELKLLNTL